MKKDKYENRHIESGRVGGSVSGSADSSAKGGVGGNVSGSAEGHTSSGASSSTSGNAGGIAGGRKVAIIGAGNVGSSIAYALTLRDVASEIVLIDTDRQRAEGEVKDIRHGFSEVGEADLYAGDYSDCRDRDLIIITAGRGRKDGETRLDLTNENIKIMKSVIGSVREYYTRGVILVISNPVDILTYKAAEWMGLPDGMVFGSGCILDESRFIRTIADHVGLGVGAVNGYVAGEHGDQQVPLWSSVTVDGTPIKAYCEAAGIAWDEQIKAEIEEKTKVMGAEIISAKSRTHYGIATCACQLADAILHKKPTVASVSSVLHGEHGCHDVALSLPSVIGPAGVEQKIPGKWTPEEQRAFQAAAEAFKEMLGELA